MEETKVVAEKAMETVSNGNGKQILIIGGAAIATLALTGLGVVVVKKGKAWRENRKEKKAKVVVSKPAKKAKTKKTEEK